MFQCAEIVGSGSGKAPVQCNSEEPGFRDFCRRGEGRGDNVVHASAKDYALSWLRR